MLFLSIIGLELLAGLTTAIISQIIKHKDTPWHEPLRKWMLTVIGLAITVYLFFGRMIRWIFDSEASRLQRARRSVEEAEDVAYTHELEGAVTDRERERIQQAYLVKLEQREQRANDNGKKTTIHMVGFIFALLALGPLILGSYYIKHQVVVEFVGDVQRLKGFEFPLFGMVFKVKMAEIACLVLVGLDLASGVILSAAYEGRRQVLAKGEQPAAALKAVFWGTLAFIGVLITLEGYLGFFRAEMQGTTGFFGVAWNVVYSMALPIATVAMGFYLKLTLSHISGILAVGVRLVFTIIGFILNIPLFGLTLVLNLVVNGVLALAYIMLFAYYAFRFQRTQQRGGPQAEEDATEVD